MRLFRRKKLGAATAENALLVRISGWVGGYQRRLADYLGRKTQYWDRRSKLIALALFCLLFGGICLLLFIKAIIHF
jgi:hypothetical protein